MAENSNSNAQPGDAVLANSVHHSTTPVFAHMGKEPCRQMSKESNAEKHENVLVM